MSDPLTDAANAISGSSPNVKRFAQLAAARIIELEQDVAALQHPTPPAPAPIFTQNYDPTSMTWLRTNGMLPTPKAWSLTPDLPDARFEVRPGDTWSNWSGERSQIQRTDIQGKEGDRWRWRFAFTLAANFALPPVFNPNAGNYLVLWEHHANTTGSPPCSLQVKGYGLFWTNVKSPNPANANDWTAFDLGPATPGRRTTVEVDALLSADPTKARTAITVDGVQDVVTGYPNLFTGGICWPMWGLYRAPSPQTMVVSFSPVERFA